MTFLGTPRSGQSIEIDQDSVDANDPDVIKRLDRIASNYDKLDDILTRLESVMALDERLTLDECDLDSSSDSFRVRKPR